MQTDKELAPQWHSRSLAELDVRIAQAEALCERRHAEIRARIADPELADPVAMAAQAADHRLLMLRRNRAALLEAGSVD